ncbi:hypothetical protein [Actinokineospora sp. UTMC 2448]|uniref:hypothetical protein n=1 Tax=Actinokineospora sp. UTMC 2448 TaxID=2268449 RepID=UPI0021645369|nr:hypothetical protein [Actinokineospora sp. UTMC 2448]
MELEVLKAFFSTGSVGALALTTLFILLKFGPNALSTVLRECTRRSLVRRALNGKTAKERERALNLLIQLEAVQSRDPQADGKDDGSPPLIEPEGGAP